MVNILGANSVSGGYEIDNSVRYNDGDSPYLSKTFSGSNAYGRVFTLSFWIKRSAISLDQYVFHARSADSQGNFARINFNADDTFQFRGYNKTYIKTNRKFRDPSAWYHIVLAVNTNDSTAGNRIKFYVNGILEPDLQTDTNPDASEFLIFGSDRPHFIGVANISGNKTEHFDGYYSEFNFVDNTQEEVTAFGEFDDNGVWIPKKYTGTYSTNGFYLQFKETGTGTDASGMGADTSGNTNHFAPVNLAAIDVTTDTPTNNFATINPLANQFNPAALTEGNTRVDFDNGTSTVYNISTIGVASGKWYCEVKAVDVPSYGEIGIASRPCIAAGNSDKLTFNEFNYGYTANNGNVKSNNTGGSSYGDSFTDGDMIGIALDLDNNKLYFSKNGTFQNSGDPTTGATGTGAVSIQAPSGTIDGVYYFAGGDNKNSDTTRMDFNFGNPAFALDSGNADANGYGDFEYAPPSGYYSLCTKNLAEFG